MRPVVLILLGGLALGAQAPKPRASKPQPYVPNPALWVLEVEGATGGWTTTKELTLRLKVADPKDPSPPKPRVPSDEEDYDYDARYNEGLHREENETWEAFRKRVDEARRLNAWRDRALQVYFNGQKDQVSYRVGHPFSRSFTLQDGENRIELRVPENGQSRVVSLFTVNSRDRLLVRLYSPDAEPSQYDWSWYSGGLQVVEPDNTESIGGEPTPSGGKNSGSLFTHYGPLPGTYTVRWFDPRAGVDGYGYDGYYEHSDAKPQRIVAEVILDPGTDRERRWRFERVVVPGTKRVTLGSFDVED